MRFLGLVLWGFRCRATSLPLLTFSIPPGIGSLFWPLCVEGQAFCSLLGDGPARHTFLPEVIPETLESGILS